MILCILSKKNLYLDESHSVTKKNGECPVNVRLTGRVMDASIPAYF